MTFETTIRFNQPEMVSQFYDAVLTEAEKIATFALVGGFYFKTVRSPMMILAAAEGMGFHFSDFEGVEFKNA